MQAKAFTPHDYQRYCINRIIDTPYIGLFLSMGLGKTVITLSAIEELRYKRWATSRVLVVAPKKVAEATWRNESAMWLHLQHLRIVEVLGTERQRLDALAQKADIYVINRDNVAWLVKTLGIRWPFDMVVLDESSSFKNPQAQRFKALKAVRPKIKRLVELTGTPAPHGLMDLWAQVYLLDGGQRLGRTLTTYRDLYFLPDKRNGYQVWTYKLKRDADKAIYQQIEDICISMKAEDYLTLPDRITDIIPVKLDAKAQAQYESLERDMLLQVSEEEFVRAGTAGVLTGKLLQLCNGAVYDESGKARLLHDCKVESFSETLEQLGDEHALVLYQFQHDIPRLIEAAEKLHKTAKVYDGPQDQTDWNEGKIDVLLAHPASCGYGLNLQRGGHHIIWFGLTWNLEQFQQANARLHRQGQECPVMIHILSVQGGMDEVVIKSLSGKERVQDALLTALKAKWTKAKEAVK